MTYNFIDNSYYILLYYTSSICISTLIFLVEILYHLLLILRQNSVDFDIKYIQIHLPGSAFWQSINMDKLFICNTLYQEKWITTLFDYCRVAVNIVIDLADDLAFSGCLINGNSSYLIWPKCLWKLNLASFLLHKNFKGVMLCLIFVVSGNEEWPIYKMTDF